MTTTRKRNRLRIFQPGNVADLDAAILAMLGMSNQLIIRKTGLTPGKITYRLRALGVSRMDYRNGDSIVAKRAMAAGTRVAKLEAKARIHKFTQPRNTGGIKE